MRKRFLKIVHKQARIFVTRSLHLTRGGTHVSKHHLFSVSKSLRGQVCVLIPHGKPHSQP